MIQRSLSIDGQREVSKLRYSKYCRITVVDKRDGMDITDIAKKSSAYDTNIGLSDK